MEALVTEAQEAILFEAYDRTLKKMTVALSRPRNLLVGFPLVLAPWRIFAAICAPAITRGVTNGPTTHVTSRSYL